MEKDELSEFKCGAESLLATDREDNNNSTQPSGPANFRCTALLQDGKRRQRPTPQWRRPVMVACMSRAASLKRSAPPRHCTGRQPIGCPAVRAQAARAPAVRRDGPVAPVAAYRGREALLAAAACRDDPDQEDPAHACGLPARIENSSLSPWAICIRQPLPNRRRMPQRLATGAVAFRHAFATQMPQAERGATALHAAQRRGPRGAAICRWRDLLRLNSGHTQCGSGNQQCR